MFSIQHTLASLVEWFAEASGFKYVRVFLSPWLAIPIMAVIFVVIAAALRASYAVMELSDVLVISVMEYYYVLLQSVIG
jgi:hypothetical protein